MKVDCTRCKVDAFKHALCEDDFCEKYCGEGTEYDFVQMLSTAEPERKKGHWYKNSTLINCSVCKHCSWSVDAYEDLVKTFKYCPNCGADMREGYKVC